MAVLQLPFLKQKKGRYLMDGLLRLNEYNIKKNAFAGAHDPSMMWDPVTKKYYSYCTDTYGPPLGLRNEIGIPVRSSEDLIHFRFEKYVLSPGSIAQAQDNGKYPKTQNFWAPFAEYVKGEYRLFYSATRAFGSSESKIWLAVGKHPLGPFENRGVVADTWGTDDTYPNAIDPHIIWDKGRCYLVYGSFFGGIYIKELEADTGLPIDHNPKNLGICISRKGRPPKLDGPEGASVIYVKETGYFYLFQSYGWLGNNYDIRVGRSKSVTGPYTDRRGIPLTEKSQGEKLANSYRFQASNPSVGKDNRNWEWGGFRGPGHGVPFYDPVRKSYFFVHHVRDGAMAESYRDEYENRLSFQKHYMMIRPMFFIEGWPVFGPEPFTGESLEPIPAEQLEGLWEMIDLDDFDNDQKISRVLDLNKDSRYFFHSVAYRCWDFENQKKTTCLTGFHETGIAFWGKVMYN